MFESLTTAFSGTHSALLMKTLRVLFLVLLAVFCLLLFKTPLPKARKSRVPPLFALAICLCLAAILAYQSTWQLAGFRNPAFMTFMRRHNPRPDAAAKLVKRGAILDCNGVKLAEAVEGDVWGRAYPLGPAGAHVVGYFHPRYGLSGVERAADAALSGATLTGKRDLEQFSRNLFIRNEAAGIDQTLTMDARLQAKAYQLLDGRPGAVVVMRPNGMIKALASAPAFDPRNPVPGNNRNAPMLNRALQGRYPPGSTFKVAVTLMAAAQKLAPQYDCPGEGFFAAPRTTPIRDSSYGEYKRRGEIWRGYGRIGLTAAFARSSNVYFAQLGLACGAERFNIFAEAAHLNERITIFRGSDGSISTMSGSLQRLEPQQRAATAQYSIGQGTMLLTPLHVTMITAAVAAGGQMWQPTLDARETPKVMNRLSTPAAAATVAALMREAVVSGTGKGADIPRLDVCGKTGTAQTGNGPDHAWFTCFAPQHKPQLVVTVLIEQGGYGAATALPVARALLEEALRLGIITNAN